VSRNISATGEGFWDGGPAQHRRDKMRAQAAIDLHVNNGSGQIAFLARINHPVPILSA